MQELAKSLTKELPPVINESKELMRIADSMALMKSTLGEAIRHAIDDISCDGCNYPEATKLAKKVADLSLIAEQLELSIETLRIKYIK